ncbi:MAG TPA: hypothetical protein DF383_07345 [Deltaproteobacteria bacterium]|nr:hypothetical protein [Deltaproteobacteria bacterium]
MEQPISAAELLRRNELHLNEIQILAPSLGALVQSCAAETQEQVEIQVKYEGYIQRQNEEITRLEKFQEMPLPSSLHYGAIPGLSSEVVEKLTRIRPHSLGQAARISGITPAAINILVMHLKKQRSAKAIAE